MKAFWWFRENSIAGMARPGFNSVHFYDLTFEEMAVLGWIGQHSCGEVPLQSYRDHLVTYIPRTFVFHKLNDEEGARAIDRLRPKETITSALQKINSRAQFYEHFEILGDTLRIKVNQSLLQREIQDLKNKNISTIVTLTERHHHRDQLAEHFDTHHIAIDDMCPPTLDQAKQLATILGNARARNQKVAVHCLAGIGRTSTMIIAANLLLGEKFEDLKEQIQRTNPKYLLTGSQAKFLETISSGF